MMSRDYPLNTTGKVYWFKPTGNTNAFMFCKSIRPVRYQIRVYLIDGPYIVLKDRGGMYMEPYGTIELEIEDSTIRLATPKEYLSKEVKLLLLSTIR